jgi:hypothetical protein
MKTLLRIIVMATLTFLMFSMADWEGNETGNSQSKDINEKEVVVNASH